MIYHTDIGTLRAQQGIIQFAHKTIGRYKMTDGMFIVEVNGRTIKTDRLGNALQELIKTDNLLPQEGK